MHGVAREIMGFLAAQVPAALVVYSLLVGKSKPSNKGAYGTVTMSAREISEIIDRSRTTVQRNLERLELANLNEIQPSNKGST